jgi:cysteine-S-conjugate beta-lyase
MTYDFDRIIERRGTDSAKWRRYGDDVIPLWVADMDFVSAEPIIQALHERADFGVLGYGWPPQELRQVIQDRLMKLYGWEVQEEQILFLPGIVPGLNLTYHTFSERGDAVMAQPPVYFHFVNDPPAHGRVLQDPPLVQSGDSYEIDFEAFEKSITDRTRVFLLCNPHNPVARVFTIHELTTLAEICLRHDIIICSDEIHCDLLYPGHQHIPIATLSPEIASRTITLMAPSKTFNTAGLSCGFAIITNPDLLERWHAGTQGLAPGSNVMGYAAALAAYRDGQEWLDQALAYLKGNRDYSARFLSERLPALKMTKMEATYLAWIDCRDLKVPGSACEFFLEKAKVALNDGSEFGKGGEGFVRLNFACPRKTLVEALYRMEEAVRHL